MAAQPRKQVVSLEHWASNISSEERYASQAKSDFGAPGSAAPRQGKATKQGGTTIVLGYEPRVAYATESRDQFTDKLAASADLSRGSAPEPGPGFGTADCIHNSLYAPAEDESPFDTEHNKYRWATGDSAGHRAGLAAIETCRATSQTLNRTRIVLGDAPAEYQTSTENALTSTLAALAASGEALAVPRRRPTVHDAPEDAPAAGGLPALVPGRLVEIGNGEPPLYETTYAAATVVSADVSALRRVWWASGCDSTCQVHPPPYPFRLTGRPSAPFSTWPWKLGHRLREARVRDRGDACDGPHCLQAWRAHSPAARPTLRQGPPHGCRRRPEALIRCAPRWGQRVCQPRWQKDDGCHPAYMPAPVVD